MKVKLVSVFLILHGLLTLNVDELKQQDTSKTQIIGSNLKTITEEELRKMIQNGQLQEVKSNGSSSQTTSSSSGSAGQVNGQLS